MARVDVPHARPGEADLLLVRVGGLVLPRDDPAPHLVLCGPAAFHGAQHGHGRAHAACLLE
eukprot:5985855-Prymnesium_polylepis.1